MQELTNILLTLGITVKEIKPEANFSHDLGLDSLDITELMMEIEQRFGVHIGHQDIDKFKTVGDVANYLASYVAPKPHASR
jgi:acyl carrier protein